MIDQMRREVRDDSGSDHERSADELADRERRGVVVARLRARFHTVPPGVSLADELIQERLLEQ